MSIINLPSQTDLSGFYVVYKGSTNIEEKGNLGISHLMEHLVCKALDPYQDDLDRLGINSNAYTSNNEIVFHMKGLEESLNKWRTKYVDLLSNFDVTKEEFENERNIVLQEYYDSFNDQQANHWLNLDRKMFGNYNAIGSGEDLKNLTYLDCLNFFEKQYIKPSFIINVSKEIEFGTDISFNNIDSDLVYTKKDHQFELQRNNDYNNKVSLIMNSELMDKDFNKINFINNMLASGLQSPFYQEIREKRGLVYYIGSSCTQLNKQGYNSIYTMTTEENIDKIVDIISTIFGDIDKFLTKERFNVVKESIQLQLKESEINRYKSVNRWITPDGWSLAEIIDDIEYLEVLSIAKKHFNMDNYTVSRDDKEFK